MAVRDLVIRTRELGGQLVTIGGGAARGITIEQPNLASDAWGPSAASFLLKRDPRRQWPDLQAYAPVVVEAQGQVVWRGRIKGTPMTDGGTARQIALNCEGKQFHLDDDAYQRNYIHTKLGDYVDIRSSLAADLTKYVTAGNVQAGDSGIVLTYPMGVLIPSPALCGVTLDFGLSLCKAVTFNWQSSNNSGSFTLFCDGHDVPDGAQSGSVETASSFTAASGASGGTGLLTFTNAHRYVSFIFQSAFAGTLGVDVWMRISLAWTVSDAAFIVGNVSALTADTIVKDALSKATLQFDADRSLIVPKSFFIPEFTMSGPSTPREVIAAANTYHGDQFRVRSDNRVEYRPLPATPSVQVGEDSRFDEASAGDASEIYTTVIVNYTGADGIPATVTRSQSTSAFTISANQPTNPGAEVNTTGWNNISGGGTLSRTTVAGEFSAGVGGFKLTSSGALNYQGVNSNAWSGGAFVPGQNYELAVDLRSPSGSVQLVNVTIDGPFVASGAGPGDGTFHTVTLSWVQPSTTAPIIIIRQPGDSTIAFFDNLVLREAAPTIINRWAFRRTKVLDTNMTLTPAAAQQIGDVFLAAHRTTPLKGKLTIPGHGCAIDVPSGRGLSCAELLDRTGDLVRIAHLTDPDTGKLGRIGRIAGANYDPASDSTVLDIDSTDTNFESLLARIGIVTGQIRG